MTHTQFLANSFTANVAFLMSNKVRKLSDELNNDMGARCQDFFLPFLAEQVFKFSRLTLKWRLYALCQLFLV